MPNHDSDKKHASDAVTWTSKKPIERDENASERRAREERRQLSGRTITVPDVRSGRDRRTGEDRRKLRLTITGRAINI